MPQQPKLTKHSLDNALAQSGSVSEAARYLGVDRRTVQRTAKRLGVDIAAVLERFAARFAAPKESAFAPLPEITYLEQLLGDPLTAEELHRLASHGWTKHDCLGENCPACLKLLDIALRSEEAKKPNHSVNPASFGLAPRRTTAPRGPHTRTRASVMESNLIVRAVRAVKNLIGRMAPETKPQPTPPDPKPERDIRRLTAADFTGPNLGEADGGTSGAPRSPDELLSRYRKLRGK